MPPKATISSLSREISILEDRLQKCMKSIATYKAKSVQKKRTNKTPSKSTPVRRADKEKTLRLYLGLPSNRRRVNVNRAKQNQNKLNRYHNRQKNGLSAERTTKNGFRYHVVLRKK